MSAQTKPRIEWVDTGRGIAIALVVLYHAAQWSKAAGFPVDGWITTNLILANIRLPMFFSLAGLFAGKWSRAPWPRLWSVKLSLFVWVYGLWSVIATFAFMAGLNLQGREGNYLAQLKPLVELIWAPRFELWFIWALALMFVLARLLHRLPIWLQLLPTGLASAFFLSSFVEVPYGWDGFLRYSFFFLLGMNCRDQFFKLAATMSRVGGALILIGTAGLSICGTLLGLNQLVPGYYFATCCAGAASGVLLSRALARFRGLPTLGRQTLPVYLTHTTIIILMCWMLAKLPDSVKELTAFFVPPLLALFAIWLALVISRAVQPNRVLKYLYEQPVWFAGLSTVRARGKDA